MTNDGSRIRIGFVNENLGGHATFHHRLIEALSEDPRVNCDVLSLDPGGLVRRMLTHPLPLPKGLDFDAPLFRNQIGQSLAARSRLRTLARSNDVIHMYSQNATPLALRYIRLRPLIISSDGTCRMTSKMLPFRYPGLGAKMGIALSAAVERHVLSAASAVVAQSNWARDAFVAEGGIDPSRVHIIRLGAPKPRFPIVRPVRSPVRIVFVGASMGRKGGWRLIDALEGSLGTTVELHLVTHELVKPRPGIVVHNDIWPNDGRIFQLLENSDIFALPTDMDMSPNAVLEAMASGLPIVSTQCGAIPEMVDDGKNGILLRPDDLRGLRSSLECLVSSPDRRAAFGAYSRQILEDRFSQADATGAFVQIVSGALSERTPWG